MVKLTMYVIGNEDSDAWFNVELEGWVDQFELEGDCLFPTFEMAHDYLQNTVKDSYAKVYKVELETTQNYDYEPVHLPCDVEVDI